MGFEHEADAQRFPIDLRVSSPPPSIPFPSPASGNRSRSTSSGSRTSARRCGTSGSGCGVSRSRCGCGPSSERSRTNSRCADIGPSRIRDSGWRAWCGDTAATTPCPAQPRSGCHLPHPGDQALARGAGAPQSAHADQLGTDGPPRHPMAAARPGNAALSRRALSPTSCCTRCVVPVRLAALAFRRRSEGNEPAIHERVPRGAPKIPSGRLPTSQGRRSIGAYQTDLARGDMCVVDADRPPRHGCRGAGFRARRLVISCVVQDVWRSTVELGRRSSELRPGPRGGKALIATMSRLHIAF